MNTLDKIVGLLQSIVETELKKSRGVFLGNHFSSELEKLIKMKFDIHEKMELDFVLGRFDKGLIQAKKGKLYQAEQIFKEASTLKKNITDIKAVNLITVFELPALSYLEYKKGHYDIAEGMLWDVMKNAEYLEKSGFALLVGHRIQQIHNIARIHFKKGCLQSGCVLINQALRFMTLKEPLPYSNAWDHNSLVSSQSLINLKSLMIWQLCSETIGILLYNHKLDTVHFELAFSGMESMGCDTLDDELHYKWFYIMKSGMSSLDKTTIGFIQDFLSGVDINYSGYVFAITIGLIKILHNSNALENILVHNLADMSWLNDSQKRSLLQYDTETKNVHFDSVKYSTSNAA